MNKKIITGRMLFCALALCLVAVFQVFAENIILKSGRVINKPVIEKGYDFIKIDFDETVLKFYYYEIASIDGKSVEIFTAPAEQTAQEIPAAANAGEGTANPEPVKKETADKDKQTVESPAEGQSAKSAGESVKPEISEKDKEAADAGQQAPALFPAPVSEKVTAQITVSPDSHGGSLAEEIEVLKREIKDKEDELARLKADSAEKDKLTALLKEQNEAFAAKEKDIFSGTVRFNDEISRLSQELEAVKKSLRDKEDDLAQEKSLSSDKDKLIAGLKEQVSAFSSTEQELNTTLNRANSGMIGLAEELQGFKKSLKEKEAALEEMKQQAGGKDRALAHLQEKANSAADKEKNFDSSLDEAGRKIAELTKNNETLTADLNAKSANLNEEAAKISRKDKIIEDLSARQAILSEKEKESTDIINKLNVQLSGLSRDIASFKNGLEAKDNHLRENEGKFIAKDELIANLAEKNKTLSEKEKQLAENLARVNADLGNISREREALRKSAGEKEAALSRLDKDFSDLSAREKNLNAQSAKSNAVAESLANNIDSLKKELGVKDNVINEINAKSKDKDAVIVSLQETNAQFAEKEKGLSSSLAQAGLSLSNFSQEVGALKKVIQAKDDAIRQEKDQSAAKDKLIASLSAQNENILRKEALIESNFDKAGESISALTKEMETLKKDLSAAEFRYKDEVARSLEKDNSLEALKAQSAAVIKKNDEYETTARALNSKLESLSREMEDVKNELALEKSRSRDKDKLIVAFKDENVRVLLSEKELSAKFDRANSRAGILEKTCGEKDAQAIQKDNLIAGLQSQNNVLAKKAESVAVTLAQSNLSVSHFAKELENFKKEFSFQGEAIKAKDSQISQKDAALSELSTKLASLTQEKNNQLNEKEGIISSIPAKDKLIESLRGQNVELSRKREELNAETARLNSETSRFTKEIGALKETLASKDAVLFRSDAQAAEKDKTIASLKEEAAAAIQKGGAITGLKGQISQKDAALSELSTKLASLTQEKKALDDTAAKLNSEISRLSGDREALRKDNETKDKLLKEKNNQLNEKEGIISSIPAKDKLIESKDTAIAGLQQRFNVLAADKDSLLGKLNEAAKKIDSLERSTTSLQKDTAGRESLNKKLQAQISVNDEAIAALRKQADAGAEKDKLLAVGKEERQKFLQKENNLKEELAKAGSEINRLNGALNTGRGDLLTQSGQIQKLEEQAEGKDKLLAAANQRNDVLSRKEKDSAAAVFRYENLAKELESVRKDFAGKETAYKEKQARSLEKDSLIAELKAQNANLAKKENDINRSFTSANLEINRLSADLAAARNEIKSKEGILQRLSNQSQGRQAVAATIKGQQLAGGSSPSKNTAGKAGDKNEALFLYEEIGRLNRKLETDSNILKAKYGQSLRKDKVIDDLKNEITKMIDEYNDESVAKEKNVAQLNNRIAALSKSKQDLAGELDAVTDEIGRLTAAFVEESKTEDSSKFSGEAPAGAGRLRNISRLIEEKDKQIGEKEKQIEYLKKVIADVMAKMKVASGGDSAGR